MKPKAIVYTSNTGFTARYAKMIGEKAKLPVYEMAEAESKLAQGSEILYMGWLMASTVKDYRKAAKRYAIAGVCGVGLCDTGALLKEVRKINKIPKDAAVFTLEHHLAGSVDGDDAFIIVYAVIAVSHWLHEILPVKGGNDAFDGVLISLEYVVHT